MSEIRDDTPALESDDTTTQPTGFLTRFIGIHTAPSKVFPSIGAFPKTWWQPTLLLIIVGVIAMALTFESIQIPLVIEQLEDQEMTEEQIDQAVQITTKIGWVMSAVGTPIFVWIVGLILHLVFGMMLGGTGRVIQAASITAHVFLIGVIESVIKIPLMLLKGDAQVYLGPAALIQADPDSVVFKLLAQLDAFTIWKVVVFSIGFSIVYRLARQKTIITLFGLWLAWVVITTVLGAAFG